MPITFAPPEADRIPSGVDTMFETRPPVGVETPAPKPLNKESAWVAAAGISTWKGIGDAIYSPGFNDDPNFNPFEHIRKTPRLASDPMVKFLIERGQFDNAGSEDEFDAQLQLGKEFVRDAQTVAASSHPFMLQLAAGAADPVNVATMAAAPFTGGASLGVTAARSTLGVVAKAAAIGAASNLASHLLQSQFQPAANEPGLNDELMTGMSGAVFGGGVGWLTHSIGNNAKSMPSTRRMQMVRKGLSDLANAEIPQTIGDRTPMARKAAVRPKPADVAPVVVNAAETPVPPPVMDEAPNAALDEVPDAVLAQRPEPDPVDAGPDAPPFDASVPLSAKQARSLARQQAKDMVESGEWDESNVGWLARQLQQTADDVERWIRPVVDRTAASVEAAKTKAKLAADAQLTDSQRGLTEAMSNQGVPFEMIDGLDQAVSDANSAPLPTKTPTAEPTPQPLSAAAAASAEAIQEKLTRPNPAKVWRSRRGFVFNPLAIFYRGDDVKIGKKIDVENAKQHGVSLTTNKDVAASYGPNVSAWRLLPHDTLTLSQEVNVSSLVERLESAQNSGGRFVQDYAGLVESLRPPKRYVASGEKSLSLEEQQVMMKVEDALRAKRRKSMMDSMFSDKFNNDPNMLGSELLSEWAKARRQLGLDVNNEAERRFLLGLGFKSTQLKEQVFVLDPSIATPADAGPQFASRPGFVINPFASRPKPPAQKPGPTVPTMTLDDAVKHELDNGYIPFLADVPDPHRTLYVLNNATPEVTKAIEDIRAKYKAANTPLNEVEHPLQGYNDLIQHVRTLTSTPAFHTAATAAELDQGLISNITTAAAGKGMGLINPITPAGRVSGITPSAEIPDAIVSQIQETMRTIAGSVQTVTRGNAVAPFTHMSPTAAEAIKGLVAHQKDMTRLALIDTYNSARRAGRDVIEYGNTKISSRFGYSAFKDAVTDYYRAMNARAAGHDGPIPPNVDPAIVQAADHLKKHFNAQRDRMIEVGMLPDTNAALKEVTDLFNRRAALTVKHQKALAAEQAKMIPNPQRVAKLQSWLASSSKRESALSDRLRSLQRNIDMQDWYMPRTYDVWTIRRNETAFTEDLETAFHSNDNFDRSGTRVTNPDQRPMLASVAENLDRDALEKAIQAKDPNFSFTKAAQNKKGTAAEIQTQVMHEAVANMDEGNLPAALLDAYREQLTAYYRGKAKGAFQAIAGKNAEGSRQLAARQMQGIDETILNRWMEQDVDRLIERSHHAIEGRWSIRKSIQLSDTMRKRTLSDGSPIRTEEDLLKFSTDLIDSLLERFGKNNDLIAPDTRLALEKMRANVHRDMKGMIDALTGNAAVTADNQLLPGASFVGRQLLKLNFLNKMGGAVLNTVNDLAPMSLNAMRAPETWRPIWDAVRGLRNMAEDDLHAIDAGFDGLIRTRQMGDIDLESGGVGIDGSTLKKITGAIDAGTDQMTGLMAKAGLINWVTNMQKRTAGVVTINWATKMSKKLLKAAQAAGVAPDEAAQKAALNAAGLTDAYDLARLNKMGFNSQAALEYHQQVYKHGLLRDDTPVSSAMSFAEYLDDTRFVKPNFGDWDASAANNKLRLMAGMSNEVNRYHVITPGIGDIPLFQARYPVLGKMFNQFQTFGLAFGNQRLAAMAQMPAKYQTYYVGVYLMLGALSDAVKQHLSGRRTLEETAAQWEEKPLGMLYGAWHTSGLSGWLQRPLAILDNMNVPFSPGVVAGNITGGTAARHFNPQQIESALGPVASDIGRGMRLVGPASNSIYNALGGTATGDTWNTQNTQSAWKLAPFQNLFWMRLGHKTTGLPLVPESLSPN